MDALRNISANVPDWLRRLDDLGKEIDRRQAELAALGVKPTPSIKNRGSTESLKLKDVADADLPRGARQQTPPGDVKPDDAQPGSPDSATTPNAVQKTTQQAIALAQARARAQVKKRHRTESMISTPDEGPPKYRSRSMIIVYYDSYVQIFFEELVKFVSASRNLMRKAKMAAKVAQIRRMAELESPDDDDESGELKAGDGEIDPLPSLRYMSTRRFGPVGPRLSRTGRSGMMGDNEKDPYEELDKGLEFVQSTCEHAAHQFLRDGDCSVEVEKVKKRLAETKVLAEKEMERVTREEPELLKESTEAGKPRTHRPASMRRELTPSKDRASTPLLASDTKLEPESRLEVDDKILPEKATSPLSHTHSEVIEADDAPIEADDNDDTEVIIPKLQFRSTRAMRRQ
jgi:hypothetical protein